jgi:hypothetical protein
MAAYELVSELGMNADDWTTLAMPNIKIIS